MAAATRISFLGLPLDAGVDAETICKGLRKKNRTNFVVFVDTNSWTLARERPEYLEALQQMSLSLASMREISSACRWLTGEDCRRVSFDMSSLAFQFFKTVVNEEISVALVGGAPSADEDVHNKLRQQYPYIRILGTVHGYGEFEPKIASIMALAPDAVVVSMDSPRQELFMLALRNAGYRGTAIASREFFEQYLSEHAFYPSWVNRWNLHFFYRLLRKPLRLWGREVVGYFFLWGLFVQASVKKYYTAWRKRS